MKVKPDVLATGSFTTNLKGSDMGRLDEASEKDLPSNDEAIAREGEENRREMDEVPPHGTEPLHEGP